MNSVFRLRHAGWRRVVLSVIATSLLPMALGGCNDQSPELTAPDATSKTDLAVPSQAFPTQYRDCDGTMSVYTVDADRAVAEGQGGSKQDAITDTIENAIKEDISGQFECDDCPGEFPEPCDRKWGTIAMGGAELEDEDENCELIDGTWYCFDWVNFDSTPGRQSAAQAGCDLCDNDDKTKAEVQVLGQ